MAPHSIQITTFHGSLRYVKCSCGWSIGCHTDRKAIRLADDHERLPSPTTDRLTIDAGDGG